MDFDAGYGIIYDVRDTVDKNTHDDVFELVFPTLLKIRTVLSDIWRISGDNLGLGSTIPGLERPVLL